MVIRPPKPEEFTKILSLDPSRAAELALSHDIFGHTVVVEDDEIVGYGVVKLFAEAIIVIDDAQSNFKKAKIIKQLADLAVGQCSHLGLKRLYAFTDDEAYAEQLVQHYSFNKITAKSLVLYLIQAEDK